MWRNMKAAELNSTLQLLVIYWLIDYSWIDFSQGIISTTDTKYTILFFTPRIYFYISRPDNSQSSIKFLVKHVTTITWEIIYNSQEWA